MIHRTRSSSNKNAEKSGWKDRAITAIFAPLFFNLSIVVVVVVVVKMKWLRWNDDVAPDGLLILSVILIAVPALIGFVVGSKKFSKFLGHCFSTNPAGENNAAITVTIWSIILLSALGILKWIGAE